MTSTSSSSVTRTGSNERKPEKAGSLEMKDLERGSAQKVNDDKPSRPRFIPFIGRKQPRAPYASLDDAPILPATHVNVVSQWTFQWIQPLLLVGYQRPLQPNDLWKLPEELEAGPLADALMSNFDRRRKNVEDWNKAIDDGSYKPSVVRRAWWKVQKATGRGDGTGKRKVGLAMALSDTFQWRFWSAGFIKVIGDTSQVTSPLVTKELIKFGTRAYYAHRGVPGIVPQSVGYGVGLCFVLWAMQVIYSLCIHQFFVRSAGTGVLARGALITAIYRRSMELSGKARITITNGKLVNHISTDVSRIDFCAGFFHMSWTAPVQLIIIIVILIVNIGVSALAGIGFLLVAVYPQGLVMKAMFNYRKKAMVWTDKRVKLIQELLGGMRIIKFFSWELPYLEKLDKIRQSELFHVRNLLVLRTANTAIAMSMPMLATVIAFLTYSALGNSQDPAKIFTSFTLFNLIRMPLMMLPMSLGTITDAHNALGRLTEVFLADTRKDAFEIDEKAEAAIVVDNASFVWEATPEESADAPKTKKQQAQLAAKLKTDKKRQRKEDKAAEKEAAKHKNDEKAVETELDGNGPVDNTAVMVGGATDAALGVPTNKSDPTITPAEQETLQLRDINVSIKKGELCAVVGPVGAGKSSFLQALIGEMKRTKGSVKFGGSIAYASQQAWMQSCSLRDNILFGQEYDEERYDRVVHDACLEADFAMLPSGDMTEIGEKGVTLSGGQKQRVNIARALYYDADVVLLDDPLSAVDAHVGKHLFEHAICGSLRHKTRVLVTHALHFLPHVDRIITIDHGRIIQQGTYEELMADVDGPFAKLYAEFGGDAEEKKEEQEADEEEAIDDAEADEPTKEKAVKAKAKAIMQEEERVTGSVSKTVYRDFFNAAKGKYTVPLLVLSLIFMQAAQVVGSYWLVWWSEDEFNATNGAYMGGYAALGVAQALGSFLMGLCSVFIGFNASAHLHYVGIHGVMHAPMSFFDTTPLGRIMNRFSKDIDTIDNTLNDAMRMAFATIASVIGAIILIAIAIPYTLPIFLAVLSLYFYAARFYRTSAREIKRLDNLLRSSLYAHFSESLSGLATIRAYGEKAKFLQRNEEYINIENRAYYLTVINQRWLGFRLDFFGSILIFVVAIFGVGSRTSISPSETGLILSYILTIQGAMSWMVRQVAEVENDMNSVERVLHYANNLEQEAPSVIEATRPPASWPAQGQIEFKKVVMSYRPELPPVLKGLSLSIKAGEKIGVVGRTGAGKSSIMQTLFRIVEISSGQIEIDGVDISTLGLRDLREKLAIIPQDALLFNGTIRSNLDPFGEHDDATLWDALRRAYLVEQDSSPTDSRRISTSPEDGTPSTPASRFTLDLPIDDEGLNLSVGERSLVSLARAVVRNAQILVLDEATASVDLSTDAKVQKTIREAFTDKTLLIIAHRLRTIIDCQRVLVMSDGQVAEFDTPINLYRRPDGIFASMCARSNISEADILKSIGGF